MKKSTIILLSFLSITLSLVFIIMSYYGIFRYFSLHYFDQEKYVKNYLNLQKAHDDKKITVVVTSTENGLKKIKPTINSLFDQTVRVDEIILVIPYELNEKIPKDIKNNVWVHNFSKDYGELNAFVPPLLKETNKDDIIIVVKDDIIYGRDFIEDLLEIHSKHNSVIYGKNDDPDYGVLIQSDYFKYGFEDYEGKDLKGWLDKYLKVDVVSSNYKESYKHW